MSSPDLLRGVAGPAGPDVSMEEIDGRLAIYVPKTEQILCLNDSATSVWRLCTGRRTGREVVVAVAAQYEMDVDAVEPEVRSLLRELLVAGALSMVDPEA